MVFPGNYAFQVGTMVPTEDRRPLLSITPQGSSRDTGAPSKGRKAGLLALAVDAQKSSPPSMDQLGPFERGRREHLGEGPGCPIPLLFTQASYLSQWPQDFTKPNPGSDAVSH